MVGTITVIVTWWRSMASRTAAGWKTGTKVVCPPTAGTARMPPSEAAWNIGVWCRYTKSLVHAPAGGHLVDVEHQGPVVDDHALGQAGGPAGVHEDGQVVLVRLGRHLRRARRHHVLVGDVVGDVAAADQHHLVDARLGAHRVDQGGEEGVGEADPAPRVLDDERQLRSAPAAG